MQRFLGFEGAVKGLTPWNPVVQVLVYYLGFASVNILVKYYRHEIWRHYIGYEWLFCFLFPEPKWISVCPFIFGRNPIDSVNCSEKKQWVGIYSPLSFTRRRDIQRHPKTFHEQLWWSIWGNVKVPTWWFIPRIVSGLVHPKHKWTTCPHKKSHCSITRVAQPT